jgi:hypothetical protein
MSNNKHNYGNIHYFFTMIWFQQWTFFQNCFPATTSRKSPPWLETTVDRVLLKELAQKVLDRNFLTIMS